uniref:Translation initiation factor IF-2, chloroplastic n=1 Tax=Neogoniolithon spectabile TaxID=231755 RepID=A0A3G3MGV8_9FLOR|nr:translation initiation factor 2 [Neogoniolithon spectabile]AYR06069.1 translation initiation factor 2 [Neogoniolithon spectabile]
MLLIKIPENHPQMYISSYTVFKKCFSLYKYNSILHLKKPKLLSDSKIILKESLLNLKNTNKLPLSFDLDQYGKSDPNNSDFFASMNNKKHKLKQKRKTKAKIQVKNLLDKQFDSIEDTEIQKESLDRSVQYVKARKTRKNSVDSLLKHSLEIPSVNDRAKEICISSSLTINELAVHLGTSSSEIIKWLFLRGIPATINELLDISIIKLVAEYYGFNIKESTVNINKSAINPDKRIEGELTAPVVTLLGHVDHGKTSIIKAILNNGQVKAETRHITQALGSYEISLDIDKDIKKLIILDTPGHAAFFSMRRRVVKLTDIAILVVAADDDLQEQTIEVINYIKSMELAHIVVISKIDKKEANVGKVKKQLEEQGISTYHNSDSIVELSAMTKCNVDSLLSCLIRLAKKENIRSNPAGPIKGYILEAYLDKQKGSLAKILLRNGTLKVGHILVAGSTYGKVKAINSNTNQRVLEISSTSIVSILCFNTVPQAGLSFIQASNEKNAKLLAASSTQTQPHTKLLNNRVSLDGSMKKNSKNVNRIVNLILKTDCQGSIEAVMHLLKSIPQNKVQLNLLLVATGEISMKEINLALTSKAIILAFNLPITAYIVDIAKKENIPIKSFDLIYYMLDYIKECMLLLVDAEYEKHVIGLAIVKDLFTVNRGIVAGCFVSKGKLEKKAPFDLIRMGKVIYTGTIDSLKKEKDDAENILADHDCGVMCHNYSLWEVGDSLEVYELRPLEKTL